MDWYAGFSICDSKSCLSSSLDPAVRSSNSSSSTRGCASDYYHVVSWGKSITKQILLVSYYQLRIHHAVAIIIIIVWENSEWLLTLGVVEVKVMGP